MTTHSATKLESDQDRLLKILIDLRGIDVPYNSRTHVIAARASLTRAIDQLDVDVGAARRKERDAG